MAFIHLLNVIEKMNKEKRVNTKAQTETTLLTSSARKCCLCYGINNDFSEKAGQIAHVNGNRSNSNLNNLAWLCLEHHDKFDGKTSQSKGYTINELKCYRDKLYIDVAKIRELSSDALLQNNDTIDFVQVFNNAKRVKISDLPKLP